MRETLVWDHALGKCVPKSRSTNRHGPVEVMRDIEPFVSIVDGTVVGSRSARRDHNRRNGVIDVGDDKTVFKKKARTTPPGLAEDIKRAMGLD